MLWIKTLHIVFVIGWFAGLFYLPRIFVNLAEEAHHGARERLLHMGQRLLRFMTVLAALAVACGIVLWLGFGIGLRGPGNGWLQAKLFLVVLVLGYHHASWRLMQRFSEGEARHSARWYRWYNEVPVVPLLGIVALVVVKPF